MDEPATGSHRPLLRLLLLLLLLALSVSLSAGRGEWLHTREQAHWGPLYRQAGDTYVVFSNLGLASGWLRSRSTGFLEAANAQYELSAQVAPLDRRTAMSRGLVLKALHREAEAREVVRKVLVRLPREEDRVPLRLLLNGPLAARPRPEALDAAYAVARNLTPAPLVFSDAYEAAGKTAQGQAAWDRGVAQAQRLLPGLKAVLAVCGTILAAGLLTLLYFCLVGVGLLRKRPARTHAPVEWSAWTALEGLLVYFLFQSLLGLLVQGIRVSPSVEGCLLLSVPLVSGLLALTWVKFSTRPPSKLGWRLTHFRRDLLLGIGLGGAVVPVAFVLTVLVQNLFHLPPQEHPLVPIFASASGPLARVFLILAACAIIPMIEETLFRGLLFGALRRAYGFAPAALISALIFAGAHRTPAAFLSLALIGVVFAWLYERTGSLVAPMAAHGIFNGFSIALMMLIYR